MKSIVPLSLYRYKPLAFIILSGILYGSLGCLGTKLFEENFSVSSMLFWRFFIASIWMIGTSRLRRQPLFSFSGSYTHLGTLSLCAVCYGLSSMLYFLASRTTGTGIAMVIFFFFPLFVGLHTFYKTGSRPDKWMVTPLLAMPIGLLLLMERNVEHPNTIGIVLSLLSAITYAIYIPKSKACLKTLGSNQFTWIVCVGSSLLFLALILFTEKLSIPSSFKTWAYLSAIGIFATAIPIQLLLEGLKEISSLKASMASVLEPATTLLLGVAVLGESITILQGVGIFVILTCSIFTQIAKE